MVYEFEYGTLQQLTKGEKMTQLAMLSGRITEARDELSALEKEFASEVQRGQSGRIKLWDEFIARINQYDSATKDGTAPITLEKMRAETHLSLREYLYQCRRDGIESRMFVPIDSDQLVHFRDGSPSKTRLPVAGG